MLLININNCFIWVGIIIGISLVLIEFIYTSVCSAQQKMAYI
jgi:hypothetical protein